MDHSISGTKSERSALKLQNKYLMMIAIGSAVLCGN